MTTKLILSELKALGNEKVKAQNIKRGAPEENQFGVKMGDIRKVAKKIKQADKNPTSESVRFNDRFSGGNLMHPV
jgi:hypothetical protein